MKDPTRSPAIPYHHNVFPNDLPANSLQLLAAELYSTLTNLAQINDLSVSLQRTARHLAARRLRAVADLLEDDDV